MSTRVLVLGFDACEITLVEKWMAEGLLPNFSALARRSRQFRLGNPMETLPGAIWPEIHTGRSSGKAGHYYIPNQLHTGEDRLRAITPEDLDSSRYFWSCASNAGRRVAVIDPVQAVASPGLNGIQLFEWGLHDRAFDVSSDPPELLEEIRRRHGDHPIRSCDTHGCTKTGYHRLLAGLLHGVPAKAEFASELLSRERWDLFFCTFSESHCVGHQFWHFLDPAHPAHDAGASAEQRNAILRVYQAIDQALAQVLQAAGDDATVYAVFSHGMGLYYDGPQLLPEVLVRLGVGAGSLGRTGQMLRRLKRVVTFLPRPIKRVVKRIVRGKAFALPVEVTGALVDPFTTSKTRAAPVANNRVGGIRLNLRGREPHGSVAPGAEADALIADLRRELLALRDPGTGMPIIERIVTAAEQFGPEHHPDVPDLMVVFSTALGLIEHCTSPAVGHVHVPVYHPHAPRTGDHSVNSRLWAAGPGIVAEPRLHAGNVLDVAPTVLHSLGVPLPPWLDGQPLEAAV